MKVLFVFTELQQKFGALRSQHGIASMSAVLKQNGYRDIGLAYFSGEIDLERWRRDLDSFKPDVVGFYSTAEQYHFVKRLIEATPRPAFTICGGPHPTCFPQCMENVPRLDAVCVGEGEYPMLELVQALDQGRDPSSIRGLWVRRNGDIVRNLTRPFIANLDELPYEDRALFGTQEAIDQYGLGQLRIMASRGCPYVCTYCSNHRQSKTQEGRYVRFRSADHVLGELREARAAYRFEEVFFDDDIFMMNRKVVNEFCARYPKEIGKPFVFCGRVEMCNPEILKQLKDAGGRRIDFGIESGNEELRRFILKRKMTNAQILEATRMAKAAGLQVKTLNMVGLPEETPAKFTDTVELNRQINPEVASIGVFYPYPGTDLYDHCLEKGYLHPDESLPENYVSLLDSILDLPGFARRQISRCLRWFGLRVYWRQSPVKALGYTAIYSKHGEFFLEISKRFRKLLRRIMKGL